MLVQYNDKKKPITALAAPGPLVGQDRDGMLLLPAPVDYVSWTERVASFAEIETRESLHGSDVFYDDDPPREI